MSLKHELRKIIVGSLLGIIVLGLLAFNALLLWVATGPRSLERLTPTIEGMLAATDGTYTVDVGETWLIWDGWRHPIDIRVRDVKVLTREGRVFSSFPEISLGIDLLSLPMGKLLPASITINKPVISLLQNEDRSISFGFGSHEGGAEAPPTVSVVALLAPLLSSDDAGNLRALKRVAIRDANVSIGNLKQGVFFKLTHVDIQAGRNRKGEIAVASAAQMIYGDKESSLQAHILMGRDLPTIDAAFDFRDVAPGLLTSLFVENSIVSAVNVPLSGQSKLSFTKEGSLQNMAFTLEGGKGSIDSDQLAGSVPVNSLRVAGTLADDAKAIRISALALDVDGTLISGDAAIGLKEEGTAVSAKLILENGNAGSVNLFWPPSLSPVSREWVTTNITNGKVTRAEVHVDIQAGDLAKPVLPKEAVDASIALEGATIRYLPEHPQVHNVKGVIHVDGVSLSADIAHADYLEGSKITAGKLALDDLNADNPYITIGIDASVTAKDAVAFLKLPRLGHADHLNLKADAIKGSGTLHAELGFHFFAPEGSEDDVSYDVVAKLKDIAQEGFMKKFDIEGAEGELLVNSRAVTFKGKGNVNGASVSESDVSYLFTPEDGFDTLIDVTAAAPVEALPKFGYPAFPFLKGTLGVKAKVKLGDNAESSVATIDLTDATVSLATIAWTKPEKTAATFTIEAEKRDGIVTIPKFHLSGDGIKAGGSAVLNRDLTEIQSASVRDIALGNTVLSTFDYELIEGGRAMVAKGASADISGIVNPPLAEGEESTFSFANFPALRLDADVARVITGTGELAKVKGEANCDVRICSKANISGQVGDAKEFNLRILRNPKGKRQFSLNAKDAGALLKSFGVIDSMEGGELTITGNYDEAATGSTLKGRAVITEHVIKDAPVLARILSLASLTGFIDALQGNGIRFTKLAAPFTLQNDVLTLNDAKTFGSAVGLSADGTITFPKKTLDIQGTVVPAYTFNNVLGKVPLVGGLLTGSDKQGIFAARYSVKGTEEKPDVSVNPLSMLTPGFLRNIFDGADKPAKTE